MGLMAISNTIPQRIARLTPLGDVLAAVEGRVSAIMPRQCALAAARGRVLAADVVVSECPPRAIALRDGFAVDSAAIADAGPYAPLPLAAMPQRVDAGEPLPNGADAVAPLDAVNARGEAVAPVAPGEGVLSAGGDATAHTPLRRAGEVLRDVDLAVIAAAGIAEVTIRAPHIRIACGSAAKTPVIDAALAVLAHAVVAAGGTALDVQRDAGRLDEALTDENADAVFAVGGTGSGRLDSGVRALARLGRVEVYGMALSPGESAAFGFVGTRPVLLVPGRIDAALALWLLIGRRLVAKLCGGGAADVTVTLPLKRKVTSTIGLVELIPVTCSGGLAEPLGCGYLSLTALARSDGWIVVPADSEGFQVGTRVAVRSWP